MQQGDQYQIMVDIQREGTSLLPADVEGIKVELGGIVRRYPGELSYDADLGCWLFPVTQEESLRFDTNVEAQVQVNFGGTPPQIIGSKVRRVLVGTSIIRTVWND